MIESAPGKQSEEEGRNPNKAYPGWTKKNKSVSGVFLPRKLIESSAFQGLNGGQMKILLQFYLKRKISGRPSPGWSMAKKVLNQGEIVFPYSQAPVARSTFSKALEVLVERGLIDVHKSGEGLYQARTYFNISDRWSDWGTSKFKERPRGKRDSNPGFQPGHRYYPPGSAT
jgi:hypothetical protein